MHCKFFSKQENLYVTKKPRVSIEFRYLVKTDHRYEFHACQFKSKFSNVWVYLKKYLFIVLPFHIIMR